LNSAQEGSTEKERQDDSTLTIAWISGEQPKDGDNDATNGKASDGDMRGGELCGYNGFCGSSHDAELPGSRAVDSSDPKGMG
jgi:hypothetical protein